MKPGMSLKQAWVALILFAAIVPVVFVMLWYGHHLYETQLNNALLIERQSNESLRDQISYELERLKTLLNNESDSLSIFLDRNGSAESLRDINTLLGVLVEQERAIHEVIIISRQLEVLAVIDPAIGLTPDLLLSPESLQSMLPHFDFDMNLELPEVAIPLLGRNYIGSPKKHEEMISFTMSVPIGQPVKAVLIAMINVKKLWLADEFKVNEITAEKTRSYILDRRGSLLNRLDDSVYKPGDFMTHMPIVRAALINGDWPLDASYNGVMNQSVYGTLTTVPSLNWGLISEVTVSKITTPILQELYEILFWVLSGVFVFAWFVLYLAGKTLIPIQHTCEAIDHLAKGDYQFDIKRSGIRELDTMVKEFNNMVERVLNREQAISNIARGVSRGSTNAFFHDLVNNLGNLFDVKYVFIGLLDTDNPEIFNTISVSDSGRTVGNLTYELKGTPCGNVVQNGACSYPDNVQEQFPADLILQKMGVISYLGSPIFDNNGATIGLMSILDNKPLVDMKHLQFTMDIFSARASAELERMHIETALRESEARFRQLAENINQVFWLGSPDWKQMFYISPAYEVIWGQSIDDLYDNPQQWFDAIHPLDKEEVVADLLKDLNNLTREISFREYRIQRPDGEVRWVKARAYPIYKDNVVVRIAGIAEDITDYKLQKEHFQLSQKMSAIGKLTGGIAHDYNNMLSIILGYSELLQNALSEQPNLLKFAEKVHHAGERGAKLTKKLLAFSSQKSMDPSVLNLNVLLHDDMLMLEKTLTARIQLKLDLADDLWQLWLDSGDLEDAIINLSINAMHAIEGNGKLTIRTSNQHLSIVEARRLDLEAGDYVVLNVADTGCGMDADTLERLFEPFFSTKGDKGTGLGLSQVYGFVERSHGAIKVYSILGHGTYFEIYFPRYETKASDRVPLEDVSVTESKGSETILLVDDETSLLEITTEVLNQQSYYVICAQSGEQALDILAIESIDLLLSDVIMPEMDGYQLAIKVKEKYPQVKIQLISGYTGNRHVNKKVEELHNNILYKPCESKTLLKRVRKLLDM